mmetsp:Transcript_1105/g.3356  ORF Transcript_1105/g.3356 Transcript_1105/m.3356 type:complete len:141 (+) Transcript_1105:177-599(+)
MEDADWDEGGSRDAAEASISELEREWEARKHTFRQQGYRDGVAEGKAQSVQHGFDEGFCLGAAQGFAAGRQRALDALKKAAGAGFQEQKDRQDTSPAKGAAVGGGGASVVAMGRGASAAVVAAARKAAVPNLNAGGTAEW